MRQKTDARYSYRLDAYGLAHNSITKRPKNTKIGTKVITLTRFEVKRSKVNVTRTINAETESVSPTNLTLNLVGG